MRVSAARTCNCRLLVMVTLLCYKYRWDRDNTANNVYPCSIAEGIQSGDIYVNDDADVETVFFWHYCGFGYISRQ